MAALWRNLILTSSLALAAMGGCQPDANGTSGSSSGGARGVVFNDDWEDPDNPLSLHEQWTKATIKGETFTVALVTTPETRVKGLGDVPEIPEDRGMLFVFPTQQRLGFVMRDCFVDIDIAYLTDRGTVGRMYTMTVDPRREGESDAAYERRLRQYHSVIPSRLALELPGGTLERLGVEIGDEVGFKDLDALKRLAR